MPACPRSCCATAPRRSLAGVVGWNQNLDDDSDSRYCSAMPVEVIVTLRERNQLTLPERIAVALQAQPGDELALTIDEASLRTAQLRVLPRSYAGIAGD